jgi:hypothetical protein
MNSEDSGSRPKPKAGREGKVRSFRATNFRTGPRRVYNQDPKPFVWTKSADAILGSIARLATKLVPAAN